MGIKTVTRQKQDAPAQGLGFKFFIAGSKPGSALAVIRLREILQDYDLHADSLQIVDIEQAPQVAKKSQVIGSPALVREYPLPRKSVIGDLSDAAIVLQALGLLFIKKQYATRVAESPQEPLILREVGRAELKTVRVLLIDFSPVVREGLKSILTMDHGIELISYPADSVQALLQLKQASDQEKPIHIVLTGTQASSLDRFQTMRHIKEQFPQVAILVLAENINGSSVIDAVHAGAGGYILLKDMNPEILLQSIHRMVEGGIQMETELLRTAVENLLQNGSKTPAECTVEAAHLTKREVNVLSLIGNGDSNKIIAETMGITLYTVKKHARNVIAKLQARSRTHAAIIAVQSGIAGNPISPVV